MQVLDLDLSHNSLGKAGIVDISHALITNSRLLKLDLGFNRLCPSGAQVCTRPAAAMAIARRRWRRRGDRSSWRR